MTPIFAKVEKQPEVAVESASVHFSCTPIMRYQLGRFQFDGGYMGLSRDDAAEFESQMAQQPVMEQIKVRRLAVRDLLESAPALVQGIDTTDNTLDGPAALAGA